jgi:hypothetical protein
MKRAMGWRPMVLLVLAAQGRAAETAPARRSGLAQVPATAPLVVYLRGLDGARDRLLVTLKKALPEMLPLIQPKLDEWIEESLEGRKLAGVPRDGPIFLVFTELPRPRVETKAAVVLAVNKYEEFRDGVLKEDERKSVKANGVGAERAVLDNGRDLYFVNKKGYAVVSPNAEVANAFAEKYDGLDGAISRVQGARLLAGDLGVYLNLDTFGKEYADQIKKAREDVVGFLDQAGGDGGKAEKNALELFKQVVGAVFQAVEDSRNLVATVEFRPGGFALHGQAELRSGSTTSAQLKDLKLSAFQELERLPSGQALYTGLQAGGRMFEALGAAIAGAEGKEARAIGKGLEQLGKAGPGTRLNTAALPASGLQVWHFEDPKKAVKARLKVLQATEAGSGLEGGILKDRPVVRPSARRYGDFDLNSITLTWDLDKMADQFRFGQDIPEESKKEMIAALKEMMGEQVQVWFGTDGKVVVQVTARDWDAANDLLDRSFKGRKGAGDATAFRDVRKELPAEATMIGLVDAVQYLVGIVDVIKPRLSGIRPLPPGYPPRPNKASPTYVGAAVSLQPGRGSLDVFLSAASVHQAYKTFVLPVGGRE